MFDHRYNPKKPPLPLLPLRFKVYGFAFVFGCGSVAPCLRGAKVLSPQLQDHEIARVDSRITRSDASFRCTGENLWFSVPALMASTMILTAAAPIDSSGWRIVLDGGTNKAEGGTS